MDNGITDNENNPILNLNYILKYIINYFSPLHIPNIQIYGT